MLEIHERLDAYRLSFDDWLRLPEQDGLCELIDGELFLIPSPSVSHQWAASRLGYFLGRHLEETGSGMHFPAPTGLRIEERRVLMPDLVVIAAEDLAAALGQVIEIAVIPRLVVEVLSPGNTQHDVVYKKGQYAARGVPEYWLVDPIHRSIDRLVLRGGNYQTEGVFAAGEVLTSPAFPGLAIPLGQVFAPAEG